MAFVKIRTTKAGSKSSTLVESFRDEKGRPRQRVLANLHGMPDILSALAKLAAQRERLREEKESLTLNVRNAQKFYNVVTSNTLAGHRYTASERKDIDRLFRDRKRLLKRVAEIDAALSLIKKNGNVIRGHCTATQDEIQAAIRKYKAELKDGETLVLGAEYMLTKAKDELRRLSL